MTDDVFRQMRGTSRDTYVTLAQSLDAPAAITSETIYFSQSMSGVVSGCLLVQQGETMYVQDANTLTLSAQVLRGFDDTTPVTASAGQLVTVNPPFTRAIVQDRLKDEIRSWGPQVFQVMTALIPVVQMQRGYDLGTLEGNIIKILRVTAPQPYYDDALDALYQPGTTNTTLRDLDFAFTYNPNANTTEFPSGKSITLTSSSTPAYVGDMNIIYAAAFNVDTSWTETLTSPRLVRWPDYCEPSACDAPCSTSKVRVATTKTSRCPPSFKPPNSSNSPPRADSATCRSGSSPTSHCARRTSKG
jgi:hypothetical protein